MAVGYSADKGQIDMRAGSLSVQIRDTFHQIEEFQNFLEGKTDAELMTDPYNYSSDDVLLLKSAFSQLDMLRQVAFGEIAAPAGTNNFLFFSAKLTGVN
jgi:hypothetical protein